MHPLKPVGPPNIQFRDTPLSLLVFLLAVLCAVAVLALLGCDNDDEHQSPLPTVQGTVALQAELVTCHDWNGLRPDKLVQPARVDANPRYCFVAGECFFDCPFRSGT